MAHHFAVETFMPSVQLRRSSQRSGLQWIRAMVLEPSNVQEQEYVGLLPSMPVDGMPIRLEYK